MRGLGVGVRGWGFVCGEAGGTEAAEHQPGGGKPGAIWGAEGGGLGIGDRGGGFEGEAAGATALGGIRRELSRGAEGAGWGWGSGVGALWGEAAGTSAGGRQPNGGRDSRAGNRVQGLGFEGRARRVGGRGH